MLLRFGVSNHRSVRDYQEFLLTASHADEFEDRLLHSSDEKLRLLPSAAIYGANASGKSTVLDSFEFMRYLIQHSHSRGSATGGMPYRPFGLDPSASKMPSRYDVDISLGEFSFHYGFTLDGKAIVQEWLYATPLNKSRKTRQTWFNRDAESDEGIYFGKELRGENKQIEKLLRPNSLFLSAAAQNSHSQLSPLYDFFVNRITNCQSEKTPFTLGMHTAEFFEDKSEYQAQALKFLRMADTGIEDFKYEDSRFDERQQRMIKGLAEVFQSVSEGDGPPPDLFSDGYKELRLVHRGIDGGRYDFDLSRESSGTLSLLGLLGPIFLRLKEGGVVFIDELNNTLHPLVSRELISLFHSRATNPGGAQLIFTTHDTNLLCDGMFRRDQVWFTEKDREGATHLFPLSDMHVSKRDNLERGYLQGRFGGVPFLSRIDSQWVDAEKIEMQSSRK